MAADPMNKPKTAAFPATKLAPFLRGMLDPTGSGQIPEEQLEPIRRLESNLAQEGDREAGG